MEADQEYINRLKGDDYASFDMLFKKYVQSIYAFVLSITKNASFTEEITQSVFVKVWEKRTQIEEHYSFKAFLFRVTYHETISFLRKERATKKREGTYSMIRPSLSNETEYQVELWSIESAINEIVDNFPAKRKQIFKMSREQGLTNKEIADRLDISVRTVENQMNSALKVLRKKLGPDHLIGFLFIYICGFNDILFKESASTLSSV